MKIQPINNNKAVYYLQFKGLWGAEKKEFVPDSHSLHGEPFNFNSGNMYIIHKDYYPFLDETKEEIENAEKNLKQKNVVGKEYGSITNPKILYSMNLKNRIPFIKKIYQAYIDGILLPAVEKNITQKLQNADLKMFIK